MTISTSRIETMDALRGLAVMGILLMNIVSFGMPNAAYMNPLAWGQPTVPDLWTWALNFILVDGKMRALFSMLFGASMIIVIEAADEKGEDGAAVHRRRMIWLALFGLFHAYFIWYGDILFTYAMCGFVAMFLVNETPRTLMKWSIGLMIVGTLLWGFAIGAIYGLEAAANAPGADAELKTSFKEVLASLGTPNSADSIKEAAAYRGGYISALSERLSVEGLFTPFALVFTSGLETMGLFALGMLMLRNGFLKGEWELTAYWQFAMRMYAIGLPPLIGITAYCWMTGFDVLDLTTHSLVTAAPFRICVALGHAAVAILLIRKFQGAAMLARFSAAGRAAFTNYIGTSILMTTLFYGYGLGWFGYLTRWQMYLMVPCAWAVMLLWSKPWLDRHHYGPLEWLWRSLARGERQKFRR